MDRERVNAFGLKNMMKLTLSLPHTYLVLINIYIILLLIMVIK